MRLFYEEQLRMLHRELTEMGSMCEQAVSLAVRAVTEGEPALSEQVQEMEAGIDKKERDIESLCVKLLLRQQPVAADLREISAAMKMISDLERIGDQAADIAVISHSTSGGEDNVSNHLQEMARETVGMVTQSIEAFVTHDLAAAREVIAYDDVVDRWFRRIRKDLIAAIAEDGENGEHWLDLLMTAKYLERIDDHATNVGEWVEYSILGKRSKDAIMPE